MNLTDGTGGTLTVLAERLDVPMAEVIRGALSLYWWVAKERSAGTRFQVQRDGELTELVVSSLDRLNDGPPLEDPPK
jgi:hypothetical protein